MSDAEKISVTVHVYFEIKDSEMYGGPGTVGYAATGITGDFRMLQNNYENYVQMQKEAYALLCRVPEENVRVITMEEYNAATEDDEEDNEEDHLGLYN